MKQSIPFDEFKKIYSQVPRLTVEVMITSEKGILLTYRNIEPFKGFWHLPGGTVLFGETLENAVKRVAQDELEVQVAVDKLIGIIEYVGEYPYSNFDQPIGLCFLCNITSGSLHPNFQATKVDFFNKIPSKTIPAVEDFLIKNKKLFNIL